MTTRPYRQGRTARAPEARLSKDERDRLIMMLDKDGLSMADWIMKHVTEAEMTFNALEAIEYFKSENGRLRESVDRYSNDWRAVCNALNTSPDSSIEIILKKINALQSMAHQNSASKRAQNR